MEGHLFLCAAHRPSNVPKGFQRHWQHGEDSANFVSTEQVGRKEACIQVTHLQKVTLKKNTDLTIPTVKLGDGCVMLGESFSLARTERVVDT